MAKTASDITPPTSVSGPNTMRILRAASASAKPPTMQGTSGGVTQNKKR
jgi:hypothetical protein